jgi:nucleoside-diphosphate-sugar epimerase
MTTLVTGASGFVGSLLVRQLIKRGDRVRALVRNPHTNRWLSPAAAEICTGDLSDLTALTRACQGVELVFHTAALTTHWSTHAEYTKTNVEGARNLLEAMERAGAPRLIHFSTHLVYGRCNGVRTEADPTQITGDGYPDSKIAAEELIRREGARRGFAWTILRPTNIYGPHDHNWMPMVARNISRRRMRLFGTAQCNASLVYGDDVAEFALECSVHPAARGEIFNVANAEQVSWEKFFQTFAAQLGATFPSMRIPYWLIHPTAGILEQVWRIARVAGPPPVTRFGVELLASDWRCSARKAEERLGFVAKTGYQQGIETTVRWLRDEGLVA